MDVDMPIAKAVDEILNHGAVVEEVRAFRAERRKRTAR